MTNKPRKPTTRVSVNHAATEGPLPSFRALLENGKVSRWRLSIGALLHGLAVSMLLMFPLIATDTLNGPRQLEETPIAPIPRGDLKGDVGVKPSGEVPTERKPSLSDLIFRVPPPEELTSESGPPINEAGIGPGTGGGEIPWGIPEGFKGTSPFTPGAQVVPPPPGQPPTPAQPVEVGGRVREPRLVRPIEPAYPRLAKQAGIEGRVELRALLDVNGRVTHIEVKRGHPALTAAATNAVSQWVYEPTYLNDRPVAVMLKVVVEFRLRN